MHAVASPPEGLFSIHQQLITNLLLLIDARTASGVPMLRCAPRSPPRRTDLFTLLS
jgi:hypothetical protein